MRVLTTPVFFFVLYAGVQGLRTVRQAAILSEDEIDNISDSSDDIVFDRHQSEESQISGSKKEPDNPIFQDPKIYGMNIGLHFILEDIIRRVALGTRVHLESLIKVLVLTHNLEKVGGAVNESNRWALKRISGLYPAALREAMES